MTGHFSMYSMLFKSRWYALAWVAWMVFIALFETGSLSHAFGTVPEPSASEAAADSDAAAREREDRAINKARENSEQAPVGRYGDPDPTFGQSPDQ